MLKIKLLSLLWLLVMTALGVQSWQLQKAKKTIAYQSQKLNAANADLNKKKSQLAKLVHNHATSQKLQQKLLRDSETVIAELHQRQKQLEELKHENQRLRDWSDAALPAAVIRLHNRPEITGYAAYQQCLSTPHALPARDGKCNH